MIEPEGFKIGDKVKLPGDDEFREILSIKETTLGEAEQVRSWVCPWQPIEAAPKDGSNILVVDQRNEVVAAYWVGTEDKGHWEVCPCSWHIEPTHWMPLPEPVEE